MPSATFRQYDAEALAEGFNEVLVSHTHRFAVKARRAPGEMWLIAGFKPLG